MTKAGGGWRRVGAVACGALGILLVVTAVLLGYATRSVFNDRAFSTRFAASLEDPRVATFVAERIADAVIKVNPDLVGLRPLLIGLGRSVVSSAPFRFAARRSALRVHQAIMSGTGEEIILSLQDIEVLLKSMASTQPGLAQRIPPRISAAFGRLGSLPGGELAVRLARLANRIRAAAIGLLALGVVLCAASVWLADHKRSAMVRLGIAHVVLALLLAIVARFGGEVLGWFAHPASVSQALAGVGGVFLGGLMVWACVLGFAGLVLAAAASSLLERVILWPWMERAWRWLAGPQPRMRLRLARGLLAALLGAAMLFWPLPSLTVLGWLVGLMVTFVGMREAFIAALHLLPRIEDRVAQRTGRTPGTSRPYALVFVGVLAVAVVATTAWLVLRSDETAATPQEVAICNGSELLCDRTLDQVVFPTTHNSMGDAQASGWMFPNQNGDFRRQLEDGIRGFLFDVHYGVPVGDRVKTELEDEAGAIAKYEAVVGKEGIDAAMRIRDRLAAGKPGERDVYMCHGFCELGATKLIPALRDVRDFLVENPGEVLIFVIQDEAVAPQDIERCFRESGLIDFVYRGPARPPWPTLREMVDTDQRVLVMAENDAAGVDWYHPAFEVLQETPWEFRDSTQFSNRPNRGGTGGSLLMMNHWIESVPMPKPSNAAVVNTHDFLMKRIRAFRRERGRLPNLVAVDFYGVGDMIAVVRELNAGPGTKPVARSTRR